VREHSKSAVSTAVHLAIAFAASLALAAPAAAAWQTRDFESPLGDRASGIGTAAEGESGFVLIIGCDGERGDRWRGVAVLHPPTSAPVELADPVPGPVRRQKVRVALGGGPPAEDSFQIAKTAAGGQILWVPEPSKFVARLLAEEKKAPGSSLAIQLRRADGKPLDLSFSLAGVNEQFAKLSPRCRDWQP